MRPASFKPTLAGKPLPFTSSYRLITTRFSTLIFLQRTFTSLVHAHAGRTQKNLAERLTLRFSRPQILVLYLKMKKILASIAVLIFSVLIFWFGALYGQHKAILHSLARDTTRLIQEVELNEIMVKYDINQNHAMIREHLERYADYLAGEYPFYTSRLYQMDNIKLILDDSIAYAASEIARIPRDESIKYWEDAIVKDSSIEEFAKKQMTTTNRYYDLLEASEFSY